VHEGYAPRLELRREGLGGDARLATGERLHRAAGALLALDRPHPLEENDGIELVRRLPAAPDVPGHRGKPTEDGEPDGEDAKLDPSRAGPRLPFHRQTS